MTTTEVLGRITNYLSAGGLFNPEMTEHDKVRDLLMDCRAIIEAQQKMIRLHCEDWASAHTHAQTTAKRLGIAEDKVEGDSYGVPSIEDLIDMIAKINGG